MSLSPTVLFFSNLQAITITSIKINLSGMMSEEQNPQFIFQQDQIPPEYKAAQQQAEEIIASLSSKERYIKVFSFDHKTTIKKQHRRPPKILVYEQTEDLTISDLVYKYAALTNQPDEGVNLDFALQGGFVLDKQKTVKQIKKILRVDNLDGLEVYMESLTDALYINQCAMQTMIQSESSFNKGAIQVPFTLPGMNYSIYVPIAPKSGLGKNKKSFQQVLTLLTTEIQRVFAKNVDKSNIQLVFKVEQKQIMNHHIDFGTLAKESKVQVRFKDQTKLPAPPRQNNSFLVISGYGVISKKLHYDDIKEKRLSDLLKQIQDRPNWDEFGIIINEFVIKPHQKLSKAESYMKNQTPVSKNFAGKIIPEILIFLAEQQRIRKANPFNIENIMDKCQSNVELRTTCESKIKDRADKTSHVHFKGQLKSVQPILLYTSELQVNPSNEKKKSSAIYRTLNMFLREQHFRTTNEIDYKQKWEYTFASQLLEQLKKIEPLQKQVLWRGVSYLPEHKIGDRILYKQFNSTSTDPKLVKNLFASEALFKITKSHSGKPIKDFSYYQIQNEVLFEPYIEFEVKNVSQIVNEQKNNKKITLFQIEEIKRPQMPDSKALYLLWVDDKTKEGLMMWNSLTDIKDTSVMIPILTSAELKVWLDNNKALLKDETVQFVLVTNMTRMEKGEKKDEAGIEAINEYRKVKPNGHIFVYIGWVEGTLNKLKKHNLNPNDKLQVSNVQQNLRKFLNEVGGLK